MVLNMYSLRKFYIYDTVLLIVISLLYSRLPSLHPPMHRRFILRPRVPAALADELPKGLEVSTQPHFAHPSATLSYFLTLAAALM